MFIALLSYKFIIRVNAVTHVKFVHTGFTLLTKNGLNSMSCRAWIRNYISINPRDMVAHPWIELNDGIAKSPLKFGHVWVITCIFHEEFRVQIVSYSYLLDLHSTCASNSCQVAVSGVGLVWKHHVESVLQYVDSKLSLCNGDSVFGDEFNETHKKSVFGGGRVGRQHTGLSQVVEIFSYVIDKNTYGCSCLSTQALKC